MPENTTGQRPGPGGRATGSKRSTPEPPAFTGSVPAAYDRDLGPVLFEPYAADLASRLPGTPGLRVLELACGTGIATRRLRRALAESATLVATDLSDAMLEHARRAVPAAGITWRRADAEALPFEDASFDAVVCQFGLMFLADKARGFREARRVLSAGGLLLASVWLPLAENPVVQAVHDAVTRLFPVDPPRFLETPYGYGDPGRLLDDLAAGGWERDHVRIETVRLETDAPPGQLVAGLVHGTPLAHGLTGRGADVDAVVRRLTRELSAAHGFARPRAALAARVITAVR